MWDGVGLGDVGGKDGYVGWKCGMGGQKGMGCSGGARRVL